MLRKEYLKTARSILRAAQTMTDQHVAGQLKALAEYYQRRAAKAARADAAKNRHRRLFALNVSAGSSSGSRNLFGGLGMRRRWFARIGFVALLFLISLPSPARDLGQWENSQPTIRA